MFDSYGRRKRSLFYWTMNFIMAQTKVQWYVPRLHHGSTSSLARGSQLANALSHLLYSLPPPPPLPSQTADWSVFIGVDTLVIKRGEKVVSLTSQSRDVTDRYEVERTSFSYV